jgi:hypothetical protein
MKRIYVVAVVAAAVTACSTHPVRCGGSLRPINKPAVSRSPVSGSRPTVGTRQAAGDEVAFHTKPPGSSSPVHTEPRS